MSIGKNFPTNYKQFLKLAKTSRRKQALPLLNRFAFRYRLAISFKGMLAEEVGATLVGYDAVTKLFLAYTAYEAVTKACKELRVYGLSSLAQNVVLDSALAARLKKNIELMDYLQSCRFSPDLTSKLALFYKSQDAHCDVSTIAFAIRNVFAHGDLTASSVGATKVGHRKALNDLAKKMLEFSDDAFSRCLVRL